MEPLQTPAKPKPRLMGKLLIVEDDELLGAGLQTRLRSLGLECDWMPNLEAGREAYRTKKYHAVLADIFLNSNEPNGLELVKEVGKAGTPLVVMSSAASLKIAKEAMNSGAAFLFEKPFEIEELVKVLVSLWEEPRGLTAMIERFLDINRLTPKEKEVARLLLKGLSNKEVAEIEGNSDRTIKFHLTTIFEKCGVKSRTELFNAIFPN